MQNGFRSQVLTTLFGMKLPTESIVWNQAYPLPILLGLVMLGVWLFLPKILAEDVRESTVLSATRTANQFKILRGYYTKNVVAKVISNGGTASYDHRTNSKAIPLPATLIHEMSALLNSEDLAVRLYSRFPFPNRQSRVLDTFERNAWDFLRANPEKIYWRREKSGGSELLRLAIADRMTEESCVSCHNSDPNSPKRDWRLGDVRGVLEVTTDISARLAVGKTHSNRIVLGVGFIAIFLTLVTTVTGRRITKPIVKLTKTMKKLSQGELDFKVPSQKRKDEIGDMARALVVFKQTAADLSSAKNELENKSTVQEIYSGELARLLKREQDQSKLQREFVAMASHEFRTPLAIIDGTAQRVLRRLDRLTSEEIHKRMTKIRRAVVRVVALIDSTLNAARLDAGTIKASFKRCDPSALISQVAKRQMDIAKSHNITVTTSGLPETISADPALLDQVFTNLLSNAVKYSPAESEIEIKAWGDGKCIFISVRDTGLGIPADEMSRMFERYFRASTSTGIVGTGIGLNLAKQLVDLHRGSIEVESIEGEGSTFTVRLPIEQDIAPQEEPQAGENEPKPTSKPVAGEFA